MDISEEGLRLTFKAKKLKGIHSCEGCYFKYTDEQPCPNDGECSTRYVLIKTERAHLKWVEEKT